MAVHVIWDWNGTLFDDLHIVVEGVNASLRMLGLATIGPDEYRASYRRPVNLFYEDLLGREITRLGVHYRLPQNRSCQVTVAVR